jgi:hypothetical protein
VDNTDAEPAPQWLIPREMAAKGTKGQKAQKNASVDRHPASG